MRKIKILVMIISIVACMAACRRKDAETVLLEQVKVQDPEEVIKEPDTIYVHVCGAVNKEGVYELPFGSRVYDAIEMAGGFREDAARAELNQAGILEDAMRLYVPTISEMEESQSKQSGKVNINNASKEELMTLPGVGEAKAESIIKYRKEKGTFRKIEDIMQISGIKEGLFEKIKDLITI